VPLGARQLRAERLGRRNMGSLDLRDDLALDCHEVFELLIEMAGHQQHGILELVLGSLERAIAERAGHDRRPDRDRRDQKQATDYEPADRAAASGGLHVDGGVCGYHRYGSLRGFATGVVTPDRTGDYPGGMELTLAIWVNQRLSVRERRPARS